jgi:hypothetical protein
MIAPNRLPIDVDAMLNASPAEKIATMLLWNESLKPSNTQSFRDETARGVGRFLIQFLLTDRSMVRPN